MDPDRVPLPPTAFPDSGPGTRARVAVESDPVVLAHSLGERVKELNCLYSVSELARRTELPLEQVIEQTVALLPPAWQYPEVTCARVVLGDREFRAGEWELVVEWQSQLVAADGAPAGLVEVGYREPRPPATEGPFLAEERSLLNAIAHVIGDMVEQRRAQAAIDETNARNRALLAAIPDIVFQLDQTGTLLGVHPGDYDALAPVLAGLIGKNVTELAVHQQLPRRTLEQALVYVRRALATGKTQLFEQRVQLAGHGHDFEVRLVVTGPTTVLGMIRDVTEKKRLEREVLEISGREQRRIGRELHDGLCQHLAAIGFLSKALARQLATTHEAAEEKAQEIVGLIDDALTMTRGLARGLNPIRLETDGLVSVLGDLAEHTQRVFGIPCRFQHQGPRVEQDPSIALHLYRIAQEALGNALKHAQPGQIAIGLDTTTPGGTLTIEDDGVGFDKPRSQGRGMGLSIMRYRAATIGATLEVTTSPGAGTTIVCRLPAQVVL